MSKEILPHDTASSRPIRFGDLGPGFLTGVADDDPSHIATYSQVGARFGYQMIWTLWAFYPLVAAIQEISAQMARVTGQGLAENLRDHYPRWLCHSLVAALLVANILNIGADLVAMGGATRLLFGGDRLVYAAGFLVLIVVLEIVVRYQRYARVLEVLSLALLAYVATAFFVHVDWHQAFLGLKPTIMQGHHFAMALVAIAGTTISPYLFFWQAGQEAEIEQRDPHQSPLLDAPKQAPQEFRRIRVDTYIGMGFSQVIAFFITVTAAATLGVHGVRHVATASEAASALAPLAGRWTFEMFTAGLVATGLLAIPAMAGACAYALAGVLSWPQGLSAKARDAPQFSRYSAGRTGGSWACALWYQFNACAVSERGPKRAGGGTDSAFYDDFGASSQPYGPFYGIGPIARHRVVGYACHDGRGPHVDRGLAGRLRRCRVSLPWGTYSVAC